MRTRNLASATLVAVTIAFASVVVQTYDDDTHYSLTYYIARSCGFTPLQAYRIASADVAIDSTKNLLTEPVQKERMLRILNGRQPGEASLYGSWQRSSILGSALGPEEPRVRFHAFRDLRATKDGAAADAAVTAREAGLWQLGIAQQNPGVFLHFVQDGPAHRGYWGLGGHWYQSMDTDDQSALVYGANTDFLSHDANHNRQMVQRTVLSLRLFMTSMTRMQHVGGFCDPGAIQPLVERLIAANPEPTAPTKIQMANKAFDMFEGAPNADRADYEVLSALHARGDFSTYRTSRQRYAFIYDSTAHEGDISGMSTYGTLTVQLRTSKPAAVSVWTVPSGFGEISYQLACEANSRTPKFDKLPVGDLMVQTVIDGKVTRTKTTLNGLVGVASVDAPAETQSKSADQCHKEAEPMARALCGPSNANAPALDPQKKAAMENDLNKKVEECKQKEKENEPNRSEPTPQPRPTPAPRPTPEPRPAPAPTPAPTPEAPPPPPPPGSGPGLGTLLLLGGGGLLAYEGYQYYQNQGCLSEAINAINITSTNACSINSSLASCENQLKQLEGQLETCCQRTGEHYNGDRNSPACK